MTEFPKFILKNNTIILDFVKNHRDLTKDITDIVGGGWYHIDKIIERKDRKRALKIDLQRQIKKHFEWETIGVAKGTQLTKDEVIEVLETLKYTWD